MTEEKYTLGEPETDGPMKDAIKFEYSNDKRFIPCDADKKDFKEMLNELEFDKCMKDSLHFSMIELDIPDPIKEKRRLKKSFEKMAECYFEYVEDLKRKAIEKIDRETEDRRKFYEDVMKRKDCEEFLEKDPTRIV